MYGNNLHEIALKKYEKHLSILGRKVLNVLVQQNTRGDFLNEGNNLNRSSNMNTFACPRPHYHNESSNFRYLNPNDFSHLNSENNVVDSVDYNSNNDCPNLQNVVDLSTTNTALFEIYKPQPIPKSDELVTCVHEDISPQITDQNIPLTFANNSFNNNDPVPTVCSLLNAFNEGDLKKNRTTGFSDEVLWENMFDTELLFDKNNIENDTCKKDRKTTKLFERDFPKKIVKNRNNKIGINISKKRIKKSRTNIEDMLPKKVRKLPEDSKAVKLNFRKQKYSTIVKKWLNDVDPTNPVDDAEIPNNAAAAAIENSSTKNEGNCLEITFKKFTGESKSKRTVQTQLTNNNGVMKYCKPKTISEINNLDKRGKEINKETTAKAKFYPPIKSQIPIKEIAYHIATIENEPPNNSLDLFESTGEEVVITIIYRNGFCQLNNHHSEDVGLPEGIMFLVKDTFYYIPNALSNFREPLQQFMNNNSWVCFEGKHILTHLLNQFGFAIDQSNSKYLDAKIGGSLLDPDNPPNNFSELQKIVGYMPEFTIATDCALQKTAWYLSLLKDCWERVQKSLVDQGLWKIFVDIEMRVLPIISDMERRGVCVDLDKLNGMEKLLMEKMNAVEQACYRAAGKTFQINSALQVRTILYDELKLDSKCNVKIRETICKGAKSTSETMLRSLMNKHPLPKLILEYRHLHKAHSTFLLGISQCVRNGVVKPIWEQNAAVTGRIASNSPNLQAVPKTPFSLTLFPDDSSNDEQVLNLRSLYVSRSGYCLLAADFRQVECRVLALAANDNKLLQALRSPDLFRVLAATWLGKQETEVSSEERERTKRVVYASMYGAGASKLADVLGLGYDHALHVAASFNRTFPSLKSFGRAVVAQCERDGKLRTPCGRTRHFRDIASAQAATKAQAERKAVNFIIQGSAADLCKMAMVLTEARLRACEPALEARLLLQLHDELVWEVLQEHLHKAAAVIKSAMEGCGYECGMPMVLPVALSCGLNWGDMKEFTPEI